MLLIICPTNPLHPKVILTKNERIKRNFLHGQKSPHLTDFGPYIKQGQKRG